MSAPKEEKKNRRERRRKGRRGEEGEEGRERGRGHAESNCPLGKNFITTTSMAGV